MESVYKYRLLLVLLESVVTVLLYTVATLPLYCDQVSLLTDLTFPTVLFLLPGSPPK